MNGCDERRLQDYLLGAVAPEEAIGLERHLAGCRDCARRIDEYREMFRMLAGLPMPPLPPDLEEAILKGIAHAPLRTTPAGRIAAWIRQPVTAGVAGILGGLLLVAFRGPILLLFGRVTGGLTVRWSTELMAALRGAIQNAREATILIHLLVDLSLKLKPLVQAMADATKAFPWQTLILYVALGSATALLLGKLVGHLRRENLSHAEP